MTQRYRRPGLALAELLTVLPVGGLILILAIPAMRQTRTLCQRTDCLTNMQRIGAAMLTYAAEDAQEQIVPIHMNMVQSCMYWEWRTVNWFAWGGDNAQIPFLVTASSVSWLLSDQPNAEYPRALLRPAYAATHRPLNGYLGEYPGVFHCPADTGYPDDPRIDHSPIANATRACYDSIGSSYRANLGGFAACGQVPSTGHFSVGPWGHRLSTLANTSCLVLLGDPMFAAMLDMAGTEPAMYGWHGVAWADNVGYCDGSVRLTSVAGAHTGLERRPQPPGGISSDTPPVCSTDILMSGPTWQYDCYPTPGAVIWGDWNGPLTQFDDCWPWMNAQQNLGGARGPGDDPPAPEDVEQLSAELWCVNDTVRQTPETPVKPAMRGQTP